MPVVTSPIDAKIDTITITMTNLQSMSHELLETSSLGRTNAVNYSLTISRHCSVRIKE